MAELHCPVCAGSLDKNGRSIRCMSCGREFPVVVGIPDLRLFGPPERTHQSDMDEARQLDEAAQSGSFEDLVVRNAEMAKVTGVRSAGLIDCYTRMSMMAEQREVNRLKELRYVAGKYAVPLPAAEYALDLGAGMGPALPYLAQRFKQVVAVDISLKHLVMARKRCNERGIGNVTFVCACAEHLPLQGEVCSFINSADVLEHVDDSTTYLREVSRVLSPGGVFWASTPNRFSVLPEGHVNLWGVGFLPRALQKPYVRMMRRTAYDGIRPPSHRELYLKLSAIFGDFRIVLPIDMHELVEPHPGIEPGLVWRLAKLYWRVADSHPASRGAGRLLERAFYPQFRILARKVLHSSTGC